MEKEIRPLKKESYTPPNVDVLDVVIDQSILANGSGNGETPDMGGEDW